MLRKTHYPDCDVWFGSHRGGDDSLDLTLFAPELAILLSIVGVAADGVSGDSVVIVDGFSVGVCERRLR